MGSWMKHIIVCSALLTISTATLAASPRSCPITTKALNALPKKEQIRCEIQAASRQLVSTQVEAAVASCQANLDDTVCKTQYPFRILREKESIANLSKCISQTLVTCIGKKLSPPVTCPTQTNQ